MKNIKINKGRPVPPKTILQLSIGAAMLSLLPATSSAAMLLYYNFENDSLTGSGGIINRAPGATVNGTLTQGSNTNSVTSFVSSGAPNGGLALSFLEPSGGGNGNSVDYIDTNFVTLALGISPSTNYTAMAWVNFGPAVTTGDDDGMIFGAATTNPALHLGGRGDQYWSGQWGDDLGGGNRDRGNWHHVAYTNDTAGIQQIYVDGVLKNSGGGNGGNPTGGTMETGVNLAIGTSSPGAAGLNGTIDEVKVFNTLLTQTEIQSAMMVVPEPSTACALLGGMALLLSRRRRSARG